MSFQEVMMGHFWTVSPLLFSKFRKPEGLGSTRFSHAVSSDVSDSVEIEGRVRHLDGADALVIIVHGLGGSYESYYARDAAMSAEHRGLSTLRINLRGAGLDGEDFYHAGLWQDLESVAQSPQLSRYEHLFVMGFSLGGHISLRLAASDKKDPRFSAVAAICPPIDIDPGVTEIDKAIAAPYRRHVMQGLMRMYKAYAKKHAVPTSIAEASRIRHIREWDKRIVAPRFGFDSAEHYYASESVHTRLQDINVPTLIVVGQQDPMVKSDIGRRWLHHLPSAAHAVQVPGGHVGFPPGVDIGVSSQGTVADQVMHYFCKQQTR